MSYLPAEVLVHTASRRGRWRRRFAVLAEGPSADRGLGRWAVRAVALAGGLSAAASTVVYAVLTGYAYRIPFLQLWLFGAALLLVPWTLRLLHGRPARPDDDVDSDAVEVGLRPFSQVEKWRRRLDTTSDDVEWFTRVVHARIVPLVEQRLRQRHGVRLAEDPERVRAILGGPLHDFLTVPLPRTPSPQELDRLITRIEEI
jgi:hypothetical protein